METSKGLHPILSSKETALLEFVAAAAGTGIVSTDLRTRDRSFGGAAHWGFRSGLRGWR
jgi:hypothetical protein